MGVAKSIKYNGGDDKVWAFVGDMAFVCYTTHGKFNYKGTENNDIAVISSVLQKVNGKWMVVHGQRSTGRSPDDTPPQFD